MRISVLTSVIVLIFISFLVLSCGKETEVVDGTDFQKERLTELIMPLQPGKFITYRVDSMVFTNFQRNTEIHKYQVKHVVDAQVTDNLNRPSYRIFRFITDSAATQPWQANGSYFITVLDDGVELIEDNLRVIKVHLPVRNGSIWPGNNHLPEDPYSAFYGFSNDDNMEDWEFYFDGDLQPSLTIQGKTYNNVYTILENDESDPVTGPSDYGSVSFAQEIYSKNIGLVYRELTMWEQQPNYTPPSTYDPYKIGFGIKMWMIAHN
jgi:hypothetical protein